MSNQVIIINADENVPLAKIISKLKEQGIEPLLMTLEDAKEAGISIEKTQLEVPKLLPLNLSVTRRGRRKNN